MGYAYGYPNGAYTESYKWFTFCESGSDKPTLSRRNILSTIEVKWDGSGDTGKGESQRSKGKASAKSVELMYTGDFWDLEGHLGVEGSSELLQSAPPKTVDEEFSTHFRMSIALFCFSSHSHYLQLRCALA